MSGYIGVKDKRNKEIKIGNTIKHGDSLYKICFGKFIAGKYSRNGTFMKDISKDSDIPLDLDILLNCEIIEPEELVVKIEIQGDALKLLEDFIKYAKLKPETMAEVMYYDLDGFNRRINLLENTINQKA